VLAAPALERVAPARASAALVQVPAAIRRVQPAGLNLVPDQQAQTARKQEVGCPTVLKLIPNQVELSPLAVAISKIVQSTGKRESGLGAEFRISLR
jgi:hypothetical protein